MTTPIPGLRGIEHVGLTVPDLDSAVDFFVSLLGAEELYRLGPVRADDHWMAVNLGVDPNAEIRAFAMLRLAQGPSLEVFEYVAADQASSGPANSDVGGHHLAFYVDDIDSAIDAIRAYGSLVLGEVKTVVEGPQAGLRWCYFMAPWGMTLEVASYPSGVAAFENRNPAVWKPGTALDEPDADLL